MTTRDLDPRTVAKLYEECKKLAPILTDRLRTAAGIARPEFSEFGKKCTVVDQLFRGTPPLEKMMRKRILVPRPEPRGSSPMEQIKGRTSFFHPKGEQTGGNYGSGF